MAKYECSKCGRKFETEEGLNTHNEHCRKKKSFLHKVTIVTLVIFGLVFLGLIFGDSDSSYTTYKPYQETSIYQESTIDQEYEIFSQEWDGYIQLLNNDAQKLEDINDKLCQPANTIDELNECITEFSPRLSIYKSHLLQARGFLMENCYLISNCLKIQEQIDDKITAVVSAQYKIDSAVESYNAKIETIQYLTKVMILGI